MGDEPAVTKAIPTYFFSTVVVRDGPRVVLVEELDGTWSLPGGRLEPGESFVDAVRREAREEAGIEIEIEGFLGFEHTPMDGWSRMGAAFVATAPPDARLKDAPDDETRRAAWFTEPELEGRALRSPRVLRLIRRAFDAPSLLPLDRVESALEG